MYYTDVRDKEILVYLKGLIEECWIIATSTLSNTRVQGVQPKPEVQVNQEAQKHSSGAVLRPVRS
jgi:hypothetical protein